MQSNYKYSKSSVYFAPSDDTLAGYLLYINRLPRTDDPEIFGMHNNANLSYQVAEATLLYISELKVFASL